MSSLCPSSSSSLPSSSSMNNRDSGSNNNNNNNNREYYHNSRRTCTSRPSSPENQHRPPPLRAAQKQQRQQQEEQQRVQSSSLLHATTTTTTRSQSTNNRNPPIIRQKHQQREEEQQRYAKATKASSSPSSTNTTTGTSGAAGISSMKKTFAGLIDRRSGRFVISSGAHVIHHRNRNKKKKRLRPSQLLRRGILTAVLLGYPLYLFRYWRLQQQPVLDLQHRQQQRQQYRRQQQQNYYKGSRTSQNHTVGAGADEHDDGFTGHSSILMRQAGLLPPRDAGTDGGNTAASAASAGLLSALSSRSNDPLWQSPVLSLKREGTELRRRYRGGGGGLASMQATKTATTFSFQDTTACQTTKRLPCRLHFPVMIRPNSYAKLTSSSAAGGALLGNGEQYQFENEEEDEEDEAEEEEMLREEEERRKQRSQSSEKRDYCLFSIKGDKGIDRPNEPNQDRALLFSPVHFLGKHYNPKNTNTNANSAWSSLLSPFQLQDLSSASSSNKNRKEGWLLGLFDGHGPFGQHSAEVAQMDLPFAILHDWPRAFAASLERQQQQQHHSTPSSSNGTALFFETLRETMKRFLTETFVRVDDPKAAAKADEAAAANASGGGGYNSRNRARKTYRKNSGLLQQIPMSGSTAVIVFKHVMNSPSTSTATAARSDHEYLHVATVGDSTAFVARWNGTGASVLYSAPKHKPADEAEHARITAAGGQVWLPDADAIAAGDSSRVVIHSQTTGLETGLAMSRSMGDVDGKRSGALVAEPAVFSLDVTQYYQTQQQQRTGATAADTSGTSTATASDNSKQTKDNNEDQLFVVAASDGVTDFVSVDVVAQRLGAALFGRGGKTTKTATSNGDADAATAAEDGGKLQGQQPEKEQQQVEMSAIINFEDACEDVVQEAAHGWHLKSREQGFNYRDDITLVATKV